MTQPNLSKKLLFYIGGMLFIGFAVAAIINSNLGAGSFDAFVAGLAGKLNLTLGISMNIIAISFLLIAAAVERKMPRFLSLVTSILLGLVIDFWMLVVFNGFATSSIMIQWVLLIAGGLALAFGVSLMISSRMPLNPTDVPVIVMNEQFGISISKAKLIFDATMLVLAFLLAGPIGWGTIVITLTLGPIIGMMNRKTDHWMHVHPHKQ